MTELAVGVNLLWCLPGQVGGSEEYLARQLVGLHDVAADVSARLYVLPGFAAAHGDVAARHELVVASLDARRRSRRVIIEATWLAHQLVGSHVVHHGGGTVPLRSPVPIVLTVHDLQYRSHPRYFTAVKRRYLQLTMPRSVRKAAVVAVPTEYVRSSVIEAFGADPDTVVVVPHGLDTPPPDEITDAVTIRQRYGIGDRRFVVYPAITHPHKNHRLLLSLMAGVWGDPDLALVLLGGRGLADDDVTAGIAERGLAGRVIRTGRVPDDDRDGLVAAAEALVFPSEYEGFGAPVLEAMALGTPVVCSDRAAFPEVVGDAGLVLPLTADAWADALTTVSRRHEFLVGKGHHRAGQFTTHAAGERLAAAYRLAAERRTGRRRRRPGERAPGTRSPEHGDGVRGRSPRNWGAAVTPPLRLVVLCPHFDPDTAPTGRVMSRIVAELVARGHRIHVVTSLPWYRAHRVDPGWTGRLTRTERPRWGTIRRVYPFPGSDRRDLLRRALGFVAFSGLAGWAGIGAGGWFRRADAVIAMSPPLTMGVTGRLVAWTHRAPLVFNIQDVFPDAAVTTGAITNRRVIAVASWLERVSYRLADAITVLSDDLQANVTGKLPSARAATVWTIPNFVDTERIRPADRMTAYRAELGIGAEPVLLYAGNVGFSQSVDLVVEAARRLPGISVVINGGGSALPQLRRSAEGLANVHFGDFLPEARLPELLATGDLHAIPLRAGLSAVSMPSKTYSSLAAGRPIVAAIDPGTAIPRILAEAGAGIAVPPDDADGFTAAVSEITGDLERARQMGTRGREWVVRAASPAAVADAYERLVTVLRRRRTGPGHR